MLAAARDYFDALRLARASGGATGERSTYVALANLLDAVGAALRPKVFCVTELADQGAGHPDMGLYSARQVQRGRARQGQTPERGVVEVKAPDDDAWLTASGDQVSRYWRRYRLVLVTNTCDFVLVGQDSDGNPARLETFRLASSADEFDARLQSPAAFARDVGARLGEYLRRALTHPASIAEPSDLAWLLASYARDGLSRIEAAADSTSLGSLRSALEEALGIRFEGERGVAFFHSTLAQTLFYGIFSAWVLWANRAPEPGGRFNWRESVWHLRAPVLRALFQQISDPGRLRPLGLVETLDWTADALDRVDKRAFFDRFGQGEAVQYFYEPFLQEFDPDLRKRLGVWYTPDEVVRYMVARVDRALKEDLGIADGLAAENVYVLDPCCGTGAYLAETLRRIAANLEDKGLGALAGARVRQAATGRVFGFEIMPAPFVVAHLRVGLALQALDAPLSDDANERPGVFLTNALTGWEPRTQKPLPFPELEEERDRAERVKQDAPILVIIGNPPYNGFAGVAVDEERELSQAYRATSRAPRPQGQGLNDLYVRFFRMAERRIADKTGQGVVCFISNYSWLDGLSFTGMRERFLEAFDAVRIDCLNGDRYRTGKVAPDGSPDPSVFSTEDDPVGIQVGTAIATLVRKPDHAPADRVAFRHLWGQSKPAQLTATSESEPRSLYEDFSPILPFGLPFMRMPVSDSWFDWPPLPDLFPASFPGVKTSRDSFLVDTDLDALKRRVEDYFNPDLSHAEIARRYPAAMRRTAIFNAQQVRDTLLARGGQLEDGFIRYAYRPFDTRWLYWEADTKLLDRPRAEYKPHVFEGNIWLVFQRKARPDLSPPVVISNIGDLNQMNSGVYCVPAYLRDEVLVKEGSDAENLPNLTYIAEKYLEGIGAGVEDLFHHVLSVLHDPAYHEANSGALRAEGPRIPLPGWPDGSEGGAAEALSESAARGREIARLLDSEADAPGVASGPLRPEIAAIAVPSTTDGRNMAGDDFNLDAGWGYFGAGQAVMPGQGRATERDYTSDERAALGDSIPALGQTTFDIHLNDRAYWKNIPAAVWNYKLGGYQVLKKWLSYRERRVLGRALRPGEALHFTDAARRIGALVLVTSK